MKKRSFILALAAGLIATVAFSAPAQAGSTVVTTTAFFSLTPNPGATANAWDFKYTDQNNNPLAGMTDLKVVNDGGLTITNGGGNGVIVGPGEILITFSPANSTTGTAAPTPGLLFTFMTTVAASDVFQGVATLTTSGSTHMTQNSMISAVPEPSSLALLGIGMTGFLALRRFLKRSKIA